MTSRRKLEPHAAILDCVAAPYSCRQHLIKFIEQLGQILTEKLMGFAETAALVEGGVIEVGRLNAEAGGDVVADESEPGALVGVKGGTCFVLLCEPALKASGDRFGKGFQHRLL